MKDTNKTGIKWHTCFLVNVDKKEHHTCSFFCPGSTAVRGANSCIWAWQIAARESLMTRTNDRVLKNDQDQEKREWEMETVRKNKEPVSWQRTRRTVRYGSLEEVDSSMKPIRKRETGS
ncbi:unnamed protein product [Lasius platythorax]|uniref:Uncharacterized protein n=1 Tax=Lasius platythorax TaxID=488582 RepID=A0AAV2NSJ7_9HYME